MEEGEENGYFDHVIISNVKMVCGKNGVKMADQAYNAQPSS
jgi:hypothetical protein